MLVVQNEENNAGMQSRWSVEILPMKLLLSTADVNSTADSTAHVNHVKREGQCLVRCGVCLGRCPLFERRTGFVPLHEMLLTHYVKTYKLCVKTYYARERQNYVSFSKARCPLRRHRDVRQQNWKSKKVMSDVASFFPWTETLVLICQILRLMALNQDIGFDLSDTASYGLVGFFLGNVVDSFRYELVWSRGAGLCQMLIINPAQNSIYEEIVDDFSYQKVWTRSKGLCLIFNILLLQNFLPKDIGLHVNNEQKEQNSVWCWEGNEAAHVCESTRGMRRLCHNVWLDWCHDY